jgi:hypothetical protein
MKHRSPTDKQLPTETSTANLANSIASRSGTSLFLVQSMIDEITPEQFETVTKIAIDSPFAAFATLEELTKAADQKATID